MSQTMKPNRSDNNNEYSLFSYIQKINFKEAPSIYDDKLQRVYTNDPDNHQIMFQQYDGIKEEFPHESKIVKNKEGNNQQIQNPYLDNHDQTPLDQVDKPKSIESQKTNDIIEPQYNYSPMTQCIFNNDNNQEIPQSYSSGSFKVSDPLDCFYQGMSTNNFQNNYSMNTCNLKNYNYFKNQMQFKSHMISTINNQQYCPFCNGIGFNQFNYKCQCTLDSNAGVYDNNNGPPQYNFNNYYHSGSFTRR